MDNPIQSYEGMGLFRHLLVPEEGGWLLATIVSGGCPVLIGVTPSKTNMEPKNGGLEDENPFQRRDFQVPC